jgi:hypothetical protein
MHLQNCYPSSIHGEDNEQWPGDASRGLPFFLYKKQRRFSFELGILPKFNVVL